MRTLTAIERNTKVKTKSTVLLWFGFMIMPLLILAAKIRQYNFFFHSLLLLTGFMAWTCTEYFFHRFIMHSSDHSRGVAKLLNHRHHHTDPADIQVTTLHRIVMTFGSIVLITLSIVLNNYFTILCGYFTGFTVFCLIHVVLHQTWSKKIFPQLHRFHVQHHCKQSDKCFGVTVTWWDHLLGTIPQDEKKISDRIIRFYYKKDKKVRSIISSNNLIDEKVYFTETRPV